MTTIVARRVRAAREAAGYTQNELADYLGLQRSAITAIENERATLTLTHLEKLPALLNRPVAWFLGLDLGLASDEAELLQIYKNLPETERGRLLALIRAYVGVFGQQSGFRPDSTPPEGGGLV